MDSTLSSTDTNAAMPDFYYGGDFMFFSIIIATYNSEATLAEALDSVLSQSFTDFEIVIVDGSSTDRTITVIEEYKKKHPCIHSVSEKDNGVYDAMNKGVKMAKGDWFYFLGSDDRLYKDDVLLKVAQAIGHHPKTKFVYGDVFTSQSFVKKYAYFNFLKLVKLNICHQAIFYHHSLFANLQYDLRYKLLADWDLNLKVFKKKNQPFYIAETISFFNLTGISERWHKHPEYKIHFSNRIKVILRYRGLFTVGQHLLVQLAKKIVKTSKI